MRERWVGTPGTVEGSPRLFLRLRRNHLLRAVRPFRVVRLQPDDVRLSLSGPRGDECPVSVLLLLLLSPGATTIIAGGKEGPGTEEIGRLSGTPSLPGSRVL